MRFLICLLVASLFSTVASAQSILVGDRNGLNVLEFDASGDFQGTFGDMDFATSGLARPLDIAFDSSGNIYVSSEGEGNPWINKFDECGTRIGNAPLVVITGPGGPAHNGLVIDSSGNLYTIAKASSVDSYLQKYNAGGGVVYSKKLSTQFGDVFSGTSEIAIDSSDHLYIIRKSGVFPTDVVRFDSDGNSLGFFGDAYNLDNPTSLAFDNAGNLYVVLGSQEIRKYNSAGVYQGVVVDSTLHAGNGPVTDLFIDSDGNFFVTNSNNNVGGVLKYNSSGVFQGLIIKPGDIGVPVNFNPTAIALLVTEDPCEPAVTVVDINVHPGSDPNPLNLQSGGATPVAIFGSTTFDVLDIDIDTLMFSESTVKVVGKSMRDLCNIEDIGGYDTEFFDNLDPTADGYDDLVCHFVTVEIVPVDDGTDRTVDVDGNLMDATAFVGTDVVKVVKEAALP